MAWPSSLFIERLFRSGDCAVDCYPITPNDDADLPVAARALRAKTAGNVKVVTARGATRTLAFTAGESRPVCVTKVFNTDTTATGLEAMV